MIHTISPTQVHYMCDTCGKVCAEAMPVTLRFNAQNHGLRIDKDDTYEIHMCTECVENIAVMRYTYAGE